MKHKVPWRLTKGLHERLYNGLQAICDVYHSVLYGWHAFKAEWLLRKECNARFEKALHDANGYRHQRRKHLSRQQHHQRPQTRY